MLVSLTKDGSLDHAVPAVIDRPPRVAAAKDEKNRAVQTSRRQGIAPVCRYQIKILKPLK
jgi:hypothetical protein